MLFAGAKVSDQLQIIEIEDKTPFAMTDQDFKKALDEGKIKDGTWVTKVTVLEKNMVVTVKQLKKINGEKQETNT